MPTETPGFHNDLINFIHAVAPVQKDANNSFYKSTYATLGAVIEHLRPLLLKYNFAIVQLVDGPTLVTRMIHISGETLSSSYPLNIDLVKDPQKLGSSITYARRFSIMAITNMAVEDDDGNSNSQEPAPKVEYKTQNSTRATQTDIMSAINKLDAKVLPALKGGDWVVPFGKKYVGKRLREIPINELRDFMDYLLQNKNDMSEQARDMIANANVLLAEIKNKT